MGLLTWEKTKEAEIKKQIEQYDSLSWTKSYRKQAVILLLVIAFLSLGGVFETSASIMIASATVCCLLAFFVYKSNQWAMMLAIILLSIHEIFQVATTFADVDNVAILGYAGGIAGGFLLWLLYMVFLWPALKVENERRKLVVNKKS